MFEPDECPRGWEWDDPEARASGEFRRHVLTCPKCAEESHEHRLLTVLLAQHDPAVTLPKAKVRELKLDLLARCSETSVRVPPRAVNPRARRPWYWGPVLAIGAAAVGALLVAAVINPILPGDEKPSPVQARVKRPPHHEMPRVAAKEDQAPAKPSSAQDHKGQQSASLPAPVREQNSRPSVPRTKGVLGAVHHSVEPYAAIGKTAPTSQLPGPKASLAQPERLVIDIGSTEQPPEFTSVDLVVSGTSESARNSVGVVYTHPEEKTP